MGKPHPVGLRDRAVLLVEQGAAHTDAARYPRVSITFVDDMVRLKRETGALAQKREDVADLRHIRFSTRQPFMANHLNRLAFIDETLVRTSMATTTGRAPRGRRPVDHAPFGHWRTQSPVGALRHDRLEAPWVILRRRTPCPVPPDPCRPWSAHS